MVTVVVTGMAGHPPDAGIVYVMVYVPAALVEGLNAPVVRLIDSPDGVAENVPPVYAFVPVSVGDCVVVTVRQNADAR
jgi:hypothetical protein